MFGLVISCRTLELILAPSVAQGGEMHLNLIFTNNSIEPLSGKEQD